MFLLENFSYRAHLAKNIALMGIESEDFFGPGCRVVVAKCGFSSKVCERYECYSWLVLKEFQSLFLVSSGKLAAAFVDSNLSK